MATKEQVKHTPGPCIYDEETMTIRVREWNRNMFMGDYRGCVIAGFQESHGGRMGCSGLEGLKDAIESNAVLIAAAPDLLEACNEVCRVMAYAPFEELQTELRNAYDKCRAAIAKAEGR